MKVGEASNQFPDFPKHKKVREKGASAPSRAGAPQTEKPAEFAETFFHAAEAGLRASLDELLDEVQAEGERLSRGHRFESLERYKELVRRFLNKVVHELYRLRPSDGGSPARGRKVYVLLEKVDQELEALAKLVLARQAPQLKILEKLDLIKGLLLDAYQ